MTERRNETRPKDMRCFFKDTHLTVVTRGGLKYVNNLRLKIDAVFALEDGLLIRAVFNSDLIQFELGANIKMGLQEGSSAKTFVYLSLLEHPLNEAFPVTMTQTKD